MAILHFTIGADAAKTGVMAAPACAGNRTVEALDKTRLWSCYCVSGGTPRRFGVGEMAIFGADLDGFSTSDGAVAAFIAIYHCVNSSEALFVVSDRFLWNGGGLILRRSKVLVESVFWRRREGWFCMIDVFFSAHPMTSYQQESSNF